MKLDSLKEKQGLISTSLLCVSGILGVLILVRLGSFYVTSAKMEKLVEEAVAQSKADPNSAKEYLAKFKEIADELKKKNMFAPPPPKPGWPVKRVEGILGNTAWINGEWRKVGDEIGGAKILEIGPTYVKIVWEGKEKIFYPFDVGTVPEPKKKEKRVEKPRPKKKKVEKKPVEEKVATTSEDDPLAWMGVKLSPKLRAKILEKWNEMSDEQKEQWKEQWNNMSDEQKEKMVEQMEEHVDDM
jgi:hypothetical protein